MKPYLLFAGNFDADRMGGMFDFKGDFDTEADAESFYKTHKGLNTWYWYHIIEHATLKILQSQYKPEAGYQSSKGWQSLTNRIS